MTEMENLTAIIGQIGRDVEAMLDAAFPGRREAREALARLGYQGSRCGWYPAKPKRRRKAAR